MHAFDRQTDGEREFSSQDRVCIPCSAIKMPCDDDDGGNGGGGGGDVIMYRCSTSGPGRGDAKRCLPDEGSQPRERKLCAHDLP